MHPSEKLHYDNYLARERQKHRVEWQKYFQQYLKYKSPFLINAGKFLKIDDSLPSVDVDPADWNLLDPQLDVADLEIKWDARQIQLRREAELRA